MRRPGWAELKDTIAGVPPLPGGSAITVEPGGAVELSGPPMDDPVAAIAAMTSDRATLRPAFLQAGLGLGAARRRPAAPGQAGEPGDRYRAMERFFIASQTGDAGAAMMTSTASVQVNLDAGPRGRWADRVRLAHALGPVMIAIAANSPLLVDSSPAGSRRGSVCGANSIRRACGRYSASAATTRPATGRGTP